MKNRDEPTDPLAREKATPYGEPEGPQPPTAWERLVKWWNMPQMKTQYSAYGSKEVPKSLLIRRVRIVFTALGILHGVISLPMLWFGLFFEETDSEIWMPAWGLFGFSALFLVIAWATFVE